MVAASTRSISASAGALSDHQATPSTGCSWAGWRRSPPRAGDGLIAHPADRKVDHPFAEVSLGKLIKPFHSGEILRKARLLELGIGTAQIVALEFGLGSHATGQEPAAERAIAEGRDFVLAAIGQDLRL